MKILLVSQELPPETGWGGIGTYVSMISHALAAAGNEVHVLSAVEGQAATTRTVQGVVIHRRPLSPPPLAGRLPESARRLRIALAVLNHVRGMDTQPDVVECPDWGAEGLAVGLTRTRPLVVRMHSSARQLFPFTRQGGHMRGLDGRAAMYLEETAVRRANLVVSTQSNLDDVGPRLGLDPRALRAIPAAVRLPEAQPYPKAGPPRVTFVGRLEARKAPDVVLQAAPAVLATVPDARFVFVGRDSGDPARRPSGTWLRNEADRLGVGGSVEFLGGLDWGGVAAELRRASVCVFPSRWECFPNVAAEAAALGRPCVVSSIPAFREVLAPDGTASFVASEESSDWAAAITELLVDRQRAQMIGRDAAAHIRQICDPGRLANLALAAYEDAIARWRGGQRAGRLRVPSSQAAPRADG